MITKMEEATWPWLGLNIGDIVSQALLVFWTTRPTEDDGCVWK